MKKAENIIFDLGGVLLDIDYNLTRTAFERLGVHHFDDMYSQVSADKLFRRLETGHIAEEDFYKELNHHTGLHLTDTEIREAWNAMLLHYRVASIDFLEKIRPRYRVFLLSNTNFIHLRELEKIYGQLGKAKPFEDYFDKALYSCAIGFRKPDAACYEWVFRHLQVEPAATLFIDDSIQNIEGAAAAWLQVLHLKQGEKIEDLGL